MQEYMTGVDLESRGIYRDRWAHFSVAMYLSPRRSASFKYDCCAAGSMFSSLLTASRSLKTFPRKSCITVSAVWDIMAACTKKIKVSGRTDSASGQRTSGQRCMPFNSTNN